VIRRRLHEILETGSDADLPSRLFDIFILAMILLNVLAVALESSAGIVERWGPVFEGFELFTTAVFTVEYVIRVWTCVESRKYSRPVLGRVRFILSPLGIIDALAVFPLYLGPFMTVDLRFVRIFRVFRLIRVFKLSRYARASGVIGRIFRMKRDELVLAGSTMLTALVLASCVMYHVENSAQPDVFSSIPATMWWSVATLTTVGYGDVVPVTVLGRVIGAVISLLGIGFFALPAGILASGFSDVMREERANSATCPHCGRSLGPSGGEIDDGSEDVQK
jgi:voltage-gated potassium channel